MAPWAVLALQSRGSAGSVSVPVLLTLSYGLGLFLLDSWGLVPDLGTASAGLLGSISSVIGLLVAFRVSSSYERWNEGRRLWSDIQSTARTLMRMLALSLSPPPDRALDQQATAAQQVLAMVPAFCYALKHHLRDECAMTSDDVRALLPDKVLDRMTPRSQVKHPSLSRQYSAKRDMERELANLNDDSAAALAARASPASCDANYPLSIIGQIHASLNAFHTTPSPSRGAPGSESVALETASWASCLGMLNTLTDKVTNCERIRDTPIPASMAIHVQRLLLLLILAIPPQLMRHLGISSVVIAALTAFVYFGLDRISMELSDPFGLEVNDLPLDRFCADIHREYREIISATASLAGVENLHFKAE